MGDGQGDARSRADAAAVRRAADHRQRTALGQAAGRGDLSAAGGGERRPPSASAAGGKEETGGVHCALRRQSACGRRARAHRGACRDADLGAHPAPVCRPVRRRRTDRDHLRHRPRGGQL